MVIGVHDREETSRKGRVRRGGQQGEQDEKKQNEYVLLSVPDTSKRYVVVSNIIMFVLIRKRILKASLLRPKRMQQNCRSSVQKSVQIYDT